MNDPKNIEATAKRTLVEEGTEFTGSFSSSCPILVRGRVSGDVVAPSLEVSVTGAVHGKVKVGQIRSQGEISGEIEADVVQLSGSVKDHTVVRAKSLEVKLAAPSGRMQVVFGECVLDVGDAPSKDAAIAATREVLAAPSAGAAPMSPAAVSAALSAGAVVSRPSARPSDRSAGAGPAATLPAITPPSESVIRSGALEASDNAGDVIEASAPKTSPASH